MYYEVVCGFPTVKKVMFKAKSKKSCYEWLDGKTDANVLFWDQYKYEYFTRKGKHLTWIRPGS